MPLPVGPIAQAHPESFFVKRDIKCTVKPIPNRELEPLAASESKAQWVAQSIHRRVNLGAQPAARAPERLRPRFFWAPAAC